MSHFISYLEIIGDLGKNSYSEIVFVEANSARIKE